MAVTRMLALTLAMAMCLLKSAAPEGATYSAYQVTSDRVCNRYHKRELQVLLQNPVLLEGRTLGGNATSRVIDCRYEIEYKGGNGGVVGVVQRMKFRHSGDLCLDYMQTIYHSRKTSGIRIKHKKKKDKTKKIYKIAKEVAKGYTRQKRDDDDDDDRGSRLCGDVLFGLHVDQNETMPPPFAFPLPPNLGYLQPGFFSGDDNPYLTLTSEASEVDPKGELQTHLHISNRMLRVDESLNISIVYSAYKVCDGNQVQSTMFHCGYGLCISRSLVNDGLVNCPFGDCIDEGNCTNAKNAIISAKIVRYKTTYSNTSSGGGTSIQTVLICVAVVAVLIAVVYCVIKKRKDKNKNKEEEEEDGEEMQGEFQDPNKAPDQPPPGYPQGQPMYPPQGQPGYPPPEGQPGYPPQGQPGYPPQGQPGYPPQGQPGYPPQGQPGYPPQGQPGYPPPQGQPGYPPPQGQPGYPPQGQPGYPPQGQPGYPPQGQPGYPPPQEGYPQSQPMYPPQGEAVYPSAQSTPYPEVTSTPAVPLQAAPPPLPDGAFGFNVPSGYPGAAPPPPGGQANAPSAPGL